jgi:hypothetical protein
MSVFRVGRLASWVISHGRWPPTLPVSMTPNVALYGGVVPTVAVLSVALPSAVLQ